MQISALPLDPCWLIAISAHPAPTSVAADGWALASRHASGLAGGCVLHNVVVALMRHPCSAHVAVHNPTVPIDLKYT